MRHARPGALRFLPAAVALLLLLVAPATAVADDKAASPQAAADAVAKAHAAGDVDAIAKLAAEKNPDPWRVADRLMGARAFDAALAFAKAGSGPDVKGLPAFVEAQKAIGPATERRTAFNEAVTAARGGMGPEALKKLEPLHADSRPDMVHIFALQTSGDLLRQLGQPGPSAARFKEAAEKAEAMGWIRHAALLYVKVAVAAWQGSDVATAGAAFDEAYRLETQRGDRVRIATMLSNMAIIDAAIGEHEQAIARYKEALEQQEALGDKMGVARTLGNMAAAQQGMGAMRAAQPNLERSLELRKELGDKEGIAVALAGLGNHYLEMNRTAKGLDHYQRARSMLRELGKRHQAALALGGIGRAYTLLGDFAKARTAFETARNEKLALGDQMGAAASLAELAELDSRLGNHARSLERFQAAYEVAKKSQGRMDIAGYASNLGLAHYWMGNYDKARTYYEQAIGGFDATQRHDRAHQVRGNLAHLMVTEGKGEEALPLFEASLAHAKARKDRRSEAMTESAIGRTLVSLQRFDDARPHLKKAIRQARSLRAPQIRFEAVAHLAAMELDAGNPDAALELSHQGLEIMQSMYEGLAENEGALARQKSSDIFSSGAIAGLMLEDAAETVHFLESGRAGALLDLLGRRERIRWQEEALPEELRTAQAEAEEAQRIAEKALARAVSRGDLRRRKKAEDQVDEANAKALVVDERIQRAMKGKDDLFYPVARSIEEIADSLEDDQALVLYGLPGRRALAVVIRRDEQRIVDLGKRAEIEAACAALDASDVEANLTEATAVLRMRLVKPLALEKDVKHVLVSPDGALSYVPFALLFDQTVSLTQSGTTHLLLKEDAKKRGTGRLGLGDAQYGEVAVEAGHGTARGRALTPLPATRLEIEKIATTKLLGADANEAKLRETVDKQKRWQSVHFACHGLLDTKNPELSSLALTQTGEDDGFLTMSEVLHMKIPADLAVLSACETGRGQIVQGEGIVGLTRAFMFAGCPRVICSLWKVDDEATRALMVKFYELWSGSEDKPGMAPADALRAAQEHVRKQPKWEHPYYWAAWVLWGPAR